MSSDNRPSKVDPLDDPDLRHAFYTRRTQPLARALRERFEAWERACATDPDAPLELSAADLALCADALVSHIWYADMVVRDAAAIEAAYAVPRAKGYEVFAQAMGFSLDDDRGPRGKYVAEAVVSTYLAALRDENATAVSEPLHKYFAHPERPLKQFVLPPWPRTAEQALEFTMEACGFPSLEATRKFLQRHITDPDVVIQQGER